MIQLKTDFETKKYRMKHHQLFKDDEVVIYEITQPFADGDGYSKWYELFKHRVMPPDRFHDEEYELYPNADEYFGLWAWSCSNEKVVNKVLKREFPNHRLVKDGFKG